MGNNQSAAASAQSPPQLPPLEKIPTTLLEPSRIEVHRDNIVLVFLSTPVTGTRAFLFYLPRRFIAEAVDSLHVTDSRGNAPTLVFPSPPATPAHYTAWQSLLANHVGSSVYTGMWMEERTLVGMHVPAPGGDATEPLIFLTGKDREKGLLTTHKLSDTRLQLPLSDGATAASALSRVKGDGALDTLCVPVVAVASGSGTGSLEIRYRVSTHQECTFNFHYLALASDALVRGEVEDLPVKAQVAFYNPLPFDLHNVRVILRDTELRSYFPPSVPGYKADWWRAELQRSVTDEHTSRLSELSNRAESEPASDAGSSDSSDDESDCADSDSEDERTENVVKSMLPPFQYEFKKLISIRHMEAVSLPLADYRASMWSGHAIYINWPEEFGEGSFSFDVMHMMMMQNTSDMVMESGECSINAAGDDNITFSSNVAKPQRHIYCTVTSTTPFIHVRSSHSTWELGRKVCYMMGSFLVYEISREWTFVFRVTNNRDDRGTMVKVASHGQRIHIQKEKRAELFSPEEFDKVPCGKGELVTRRDSNGDFEFWVPPGSEKVLVLREIKRKKHSFLVNSSPLRSVERLVRGGGISTALEEALREAVKAGKERNAAILEHSMCATRARLLMSGLKRSDVDQPGIGDAVETVESDRRMFEEKMKMIEEVKNRMVELKTVLRGKKAVLLELRDKIGELVACNQVVAHGHST